jgi:hypothetical protein
MAKGRLFFQSALGERCIVAVVRASVLVSGLFVFLLACGTRTSIYAQICTEGRQVACACPGASVAVQVCLPGGIWGPCQCASASPGSGGVPGQGGMPGVGGAGSAAAGRSGSGGVAGAGGRIGGAGGTSSSHGGTSGKNPDAAQSSGIDLAQGTSQLIDVFVGDLGIYVVTTDGVVLFDRGGSQRALAPAARQVTAAAFDGTQLVVADRAKLTTYDSALSAIVSADLMEACAATVLVSRDRFVCGPSNDWDRIFYTYDARTGALLATSNAYTYNGIPMRRVPGTDDFITVTSDLSPSDFHLYTVLSNGQVSYVNESPYHGDFSVTTTYAFDGSPPTHLITSAGLLLKIYDTGCTVDASSFTSTCFVKDGALGTLSGNQYFVSMDSDAAGTIFGLVDPSTSYALSGPCAQGCLLERVDVAARTILSQSIAHLGIARSVAFRHDPIGNAAVVGYIVGTGSYYFASDPYPGYRVTVLPY